MLVELGSRSLCTFPQIFVIIFEELQFPEVTKSLGRQGLTLKFGSSNNYEWELLV